MSIFRNFGLAAALLATTAVAAFAEVKLALSTSQNSTDPLAIAMEDAAKAIGERSKGDIVVTVYPSSQLGSDNDVLEQIRNGAAIAVLVDAGRLAPFQKELGILSAPYLVDEWSQYAAITSSEPYKEWVEPWWFHDSFEGIRRFREMTTETAGFLNTVGFNDDTRELCSIPARHDVSRRADSAFLAELVTSHRLDEAEAYDIAPLLAGGLARDGYRL